LRKFRALTAAIVVLVGVLVAYAASAPAAMYWGATISGAPYGQTSSAPMNTNAWDLFERHAGRRIGILNMSQPWGQFEEDEMTPTHGRNAIPIVTMGLGGTTLEQIANGGQDAVIRNWARDAKAWGHPFFFAPWWEMNGEWYAWGRDPNFVAAWRRFHDLVVQEGATNVTWTWVTNSLWYDPLSDPAPWYPGDAYVDWTGIDTYNWGRNPAQPDKWINPDQTITPTLTRVREIAPSKPVAIVEDASSEYGGNKTEWIREMLGTYLPHHPEIGAYLWFNWNFEKDNGLQADWPIETSAPAQQAFRQGIQSALFRQAPSLPSLTKVPPPGPPGSGSPNQFDLSANGEEATAPQLAVDPDGTATVVWSALDPTVPAAERSYEVYARRVGADGTPEKTAMRLSVPGGDALSPDIAIGPDGSATVVWIRWDGTNFVVQGRRIESDGTLGPILALSATGRDAAEPEVVVGTDGTATAVWKRFDGFNFLIKVKQIDPEGSILPMENNTPSASGRNAGEPEVAIGAGGSASIVWTRFDGANTIVQERRVTETGLLEATTDDLSAVGQNAVEPGLTVAADGTETVTWARSDGSNTIVQVRQVAPDGTPAASTTDLSASGRGAAEPRIAPGPGAGATVVWERFDGANWIIQERRVTAAGLADGAANAFSATGADAAEPQVVVAPDGSATVVWSLFNGSNFVVQKRGLSAAGSVSGAAVALSTAAARAGSPQVVDSPYGGAAFAWRRFDGATDVVQGINASGPPPAPLTSLAPGGHDFGTVDVGAGPSSPRRFDLTNSGTAALSVSSISIGGADPGQFELSETTTCTGAPVPPGGACHFSVAFDPSVAGGATAEVTVSSNSANGPDTASLSGTAVAAPATTNRSPQVKAAAGRSAPDNSFTIGKATLNKKSGTASLPVTLPGPGTVIVSGAGVSSKSAAGPATLSFKISARGAKKRILAQRGAIRLKLSVAYIPIGGERNAKSTFVRLRKSK
jgi:hypothetical protein